MVGFELVLGWGFEEISSLLQTLGACPERGHCCHRVIMEIELGS